jgi:DNA-binding NtrC family response regulator
VEDDAVLRRTCSRLLQVLLPEATVLVADSGKEARRLLATHAPSVLLVDRGLPDADGAQLIAALKQVQPSAFAILMTGGAPTAALDAETTAAIDHLLLKPFEIADLATLLERAPNAPAQAPAQRGALRQAMPAASRGIEPHLADRATTLAQQTRHDVLDRLNRLSLCARALEADVHACTAVPVEQLVRQHVERVVRIVHEVAELLAPPRAPGEQDDGGVE